MGIISEFKEFALKGNMVDMAIGIIIGGAFGTIVKSLVDDILMPPLGMAMGGIDFSDMAISLSKLGLASVATAEKGEVLIKYGSFINAMISFLIVAFALFMLVKGMNKAKAAMERKKKEEEAVAPAEAAWTRQDLLLQEIRDLLKTK
jgi:large conductance mechanosensitive channel